jgi:hypothetical protein
MTPSDQAPNLRFDGRTLIFDVITQRHVMWIDGVVVLPVGTTVDLGPPNVEASVTGVRLQAGKNQSSAAVILSVEVPAKYWEETGL